FQMLQAVANHYHFDLEIPFEQLNKEVQQAVLYGSGKEKITFTYLNEQGRAHQQVHPFEGIIPALERRYRETESQTVREELAKFINARECPECEGTRLCRAARHVTVNGEPIFAISA